MTTKNGLKHSEYEPLVLNIIHNIHLRLAISRNDFIIGTFEPYLQLVLIEIDITRRLKYYRAQTEEIVRKILKCNCREEQTYIV